MESGRQREIVLRVLSATSLAALALGATLYHAVSGKRPPDAPSRMVSDEYVPAGDVALSSYRPQFLAAIDKALRLDVNERPQSVAVWRDMLFAEEPKRRRGLGLGRALERLRTGDAAAPAPQPGMPQGGAFRGAFGGAAMGAVGGAIGGDAGKGAAIGAAVGGLFGAMRRARWAEQEQQQQQSYAAQQQNAMAQGHAAYNRAFGACMTGRGYSVSM